MQRRIHHAENFSRADFFVVPLTTFAHSQNFSLDDDHGKLFARDNLPRLHGQSDGSFQDMTVLNEIEDAKKVFEYARRLPNVTSVSIAVHSQGGVVASIVAGELGAKKIKAVVLMAPAAVLRDDAIRRNLFGVTYDSINPPAFVEIPRR